MFLVNAEIAMIKVQKYVNCAIWQGMFLVLNNISFCKTFKNVVYHQC